MNNRKLNILLLVLSVIGLGVGYVLTNSIKFGICIANPTVTQASCINFYERLGDPIFYGMGALALVFLTLLTIPKAWPAWKRFAIWFVPVAAILLAIYPEPNSWDVLPSPQEFSKWVSGIYILVSVWIIVASKRKTN